MCKPSNQKEKPLSLIRIRIRSDRHPGLADPDPEFLKNYFFLAIFYFAVFQPLLISYTHILSNSIATVLFFTPYPLSIEMYLAEIGVNRNARIKGEARRF
jgi:hypothetical protein